MMKLTDEKIQSQSTPIVPTEFLFTREQRKILYRSDNWIVYNCFLDYVNREVYGDQFFSFEEFQESLADVYGYTEEFIEEGLYQLIKAGILIDENDMVFEPTLRRSLILKEMAESKDNRPFRTLRPFSVLSQNELYKYLLFVVQRHKSLPPMFRWRSVYEYMKLEKILRVTQEDYHKRRESIIEIGEFALYQTEAIDTETIKSILTDYFIHEGYIKPPNSHEAKKEDALG